MVYLNASDDAISQSVFSDGEWRNLEIIQATEPPAANSTLSLSSNILNIQYNNQSTMVLSSVVTYQQKNSSFIMINIYPFGRDSEVPANESNLNLLQDNQIYILNDALIEQSPGAGFSCIVNCRSPTQNSPLFPQYSVRYNLGQQFSQCASTQYHPNHPQIMGNTVYFNLTTNGIGVNWDFDEDYGVPGGDDSGDGGIWGNLIIPQHNVNALIFQVRELFLQISLLRRR